MKKGSSIKLRITMWYAMVMVVSFVAILIVVGTLSYQLSMDSIESDLMLQTNSVADQIRTRITKSLYASLESKEHFQNVSIYSEDGEFIVGQHNFDISVVKFKDGVRRRETFNGEEHIVYDVLKVPAFGDDPPNYWIRGAISVDNSKVFYKNQIIILLAMMPVLLLIATFGGYHIARKAFAPVNKIVQTANDIYSHNDITKRIPVDPESRKDEIHDLAITLNQMLERIDGVLTKEKQFTSDASHELRTPISVILAQGEYLLDIVENEKERELAADIVFEANRLSSLVAKLLTLSRIDNNRQKLNKREIDPEAMIDSVVYAMAELAEKKNIKIDTEVNCRRHLFADEDLLVSALGNLVSNAIKYSRENGLIIISAYDAEDGITFSVKDTGIGIAPENIEKIWTRFYRADDVRNEEDGSCGLGLSIVKSIVDLHGGKAEAYSVLDVGSEFCITL